VTLNYTFSGEGRNLRPDVHRNIVYSPICGRYKTVIEVRPPRYCKCSVMLLCYCWYKKVSCQDSYKNFV